MSFDELKKVWQQQDSAGHVMVESNALLKLVRRNQQTMDSTIFWRDVWEVVCALLMVPVWILMGLGMDLPWTWYLTIPAFLWLAGYLVLNRRIQRRHALNPGDSLRESVEISLVQVDHQIHRLKNVLWWYLLPFATTISIFLLHVGRLDTLAAIAVLYWAVYLLNQRAVHRNWQPQRDELQALLDSLSEADSTTTNITPGIPRKTTTGRFPMFLISLALAICVTLGGFLALDGCAEEKTWGETPVRRTEILRAPHFDNVSAFGKEEHDKINEWLRSQLKLAGYPSLSVAITRGSNVVYRGAFGFEDIESRRRATTETMYHTASVSKAFTANLAVLLDEDGVIDLDQPLAKYLPDDIRIGTAPEDGATITLRQLASHTSGLPRGVPGVVQSVENRYAMEPNRLYRHLSNVELLFEPGSKELYSNLGMGLLGHVLERAAGKPFHRLLRNRVLGPLEMERSDIHVSKTLTPATGYGSSLPRRAEGHSYSKRLEASGGLVASATDLANFLAAQMEPGLLSSNALSQLHTATRLSDRSAARTALGWSVRKRESIGRILKKNGGRNNCSAWIGFAPDHGVGVAVVTNCGDPNVDPIGYWLLERAIPGVEPKILDRNPVTKSEYAKVAPFSGVRWENDRPIVKVRSKWSRLESIDGLPVDRIMEFARREFGDQARKRFAEDLVEVLSTMGRTPKWKVSLKLEHNGRTEESEEVMTAAKRKLVRNLPPRDQSS